MKTAPPDFPHTLHSRRLTLRRLVASDAPPLFSRCFQQADPLRFVSFAPHRTVADTERYVADSIARWEAGDRKEYALLHNASAEVVGVVGVYIHLGRCSLGSMRAGRQPPAGRPHPRSGGQVVRRREMTRKTDRRETLSAVAATGIASVGLLYPPLGIASVPFVLYASRRFFRASWQQLKQGKIDVESLLVLSILGMLFTGRILSPDPPTPGAGLSQRAGRPPASPKPPAYRSHTPPPAAPPSHTHPAPHSFPALPARRSPAVIRASWTAPWHPRNNSPPPAPARFPAHPGTPPDTPPPADAPAPPPPAACRRSP